MAVFCRTMAAVGGTAVGIVTGVFLSGSPGQVWKASETISIVSDCSGALREIDIHYVEKSGSGFVETTCDLLAALPSNVAVRVVTARRKEFEGLMTELRARGCDTGREITPVVTGEEVTPWAKDRFGTMRTRRGDPVLVVPPVRSLSTGARAHDEKVPERLASVLSGVACRALPFFFEGGDFLADDTNVYVAASMLARNMPWDDDNPESLIAMIGTTLGRKVVRLGMDAGEVPDHHIGMYVTPLGRNAVAVGDPFLGKELCAGLPDGGKGMEIEEDETKYAPFVKAREELERAGVRVVRLPLVLTRLPRVFVTYNNCLLETRPGEHRVYMPVYGVPVLDDAAKRVYEAEGWEVLPIRVGKVYRFTGSLRCLVGVIRRS